MVEVLLVWQQQSPPPSTDGLSLWEVFLVVAAIIGAAAAVQQLVSWLTGRRRQRALQEFAEEVADQIDSRATERELSRLRQVAASIQNQIDQELPREARRVYLRNRLDTLAQTIGELYTEYEAIESELRVERDATLLEARLRSAIEETIVPQYHLHQRRQRQLRLLLVATLLLALIPLLVPFDNLLLLPILVYFNGVGHTDDFPASDLIGGVLTASLVVGVILAAIVVGRVPKTVGHGAWFRRLTRAAITLLLGGVVFLTGALALRNQAVQSHEEWDQHSTDMYADDGTLSEAEQSRDEQLWAAYVRVRGWAAVLSHISTTLIAISLAIVALLAYRGGRNVGLGKILKPFLRSSDSAKHP